MRWVLKQIALDAPVLPTAANFRFKANSDCSCVGICDADVIRGELRLTRMCSTSWRCSTLIIADFPTCSD